MRAVFALYCLSLFFQVGFIFVYSCCNLLGFKAFVVCRPSGLAHLSHKVGQCKVCRRSCLHTGIQYERSFGYVFTHQHVYVYSITPVCSGFVACKGGGGRFAVQCCIWGLQMGVRVCRLDGFDESRVSRVCPSIANACACMSNTRLQEISFRI